MKKVLTFNGSPRKQGNTSLLLQHFHDGVKQHTNLVEEINTHDIELKYCCGCLRCNILGKCATTGDDWENISKKIHEADVLVFATPIYFHHVTAPLKMLIDRFRSFIHVQITETGLIHTPHKKWNKDFVLLLCMGSSDAKDAKPVIDLFNYMTSILGSENKLHVITATRLAVVKQVIKNEEELKLLYSKLKLPVHLAKEDAKQNKEILKQCFQLGKILTQ